MKNNVLIIDTDIENCKRIKYNLQNDITAEALSPRTEATTRSGYPTGKKGNQIRG